MLFRRSKAKDRTKADPKAPVPSPTPSAPAAPAPPKPRLATRHVEPVKKLIGQILVGEGLVSKEALDIALERQKTTGKRVVETLMELEHLARSDFETLMARQPGIASIDLDNYEIPRDLVATIPKQMAIEKQVFPIDRLGKLLTIGMVCPLDTETMASIQEASGLRVKALLCSYEDIMECIKKYYPKDE